MAAFELGATPRSNHDDSIDESDDLAPMGGAADSALGRQRVAYLATYRAASALTHELETLFDETIAQAHVLAISHTGAKAVVTRSPTRCVVQLGPVGLSVSWIRGGQGAPGEGELLIMEWQGDIGGRTRPLNAVPAVLIREYSFRAEATSPSDWLWRSQATLSGDSARELVTYCMVSLASALTSRNAPADPSAGIDAPGVS